MPVPVPTFIGSNGTNPTHKPAVETVQLVVLAISGGAPTVSGAGVTWTRRIPSFDDGLLAFFTAIGPGVAGQLTVTNFSQWDWIEISGAKTTGNPVEKSLCTSAGGTSPSTVTFGWGIPPAADSLSIARTSAISGAAAADISGNFNSSIGSEYYATSNNLTLAVTDQEPTGESFSMAALLIAFPTAPLVTPGNSEYWRLKRKARIIYHRFRR